MLCTIEIHTVLLVLGEMCLFQEPRRPSPVLLVGQIYRLSSSMLVVEAS